MCIRGESRGLPTSAKGAKNTLFVNVASCLSLLTYAYLRILKMRLYVFGEIYKIVVRKTR